MKENKALLVGVGGAGVSMVKTICGCEDFNQFDSFFIDTDKKCLRRKRREKRLLIGERLTCGMGSGGQPEIGAKAAKDSLGDIMAVLRDYDQVFIIFGGGGGTGGGAAPVIIRRASEEGVPIIAVTTKPHSFESNTRKSNAESTIDDLKNAGIETSVVDLAELLKYVSSPSMSISEFSDYCSIKVVGNLVAKRAEEIGARPVASKRMKMEDFVIDTYNAESYTDTSSGNAEIESLIDKLRGLKRDQFSMNSLVTEIHERLCEIFDERKVDLIETELGTLTRRWEENGYKWVIEL